MDLLQNSGCFEKTKSCSSFFCNKTIYQRGSKACKAYEKEGHIVGNHTVHHKSMPTLSDRDNKQEIIDCAEYCKEATGYDMDPLSDLQWESIMREH